RNGTALDRVKYYGVLNPTRWIQLKILTTSPPNSPLQPERVAVILAESPDSDRFQTPYGAGIALQVWLGFRGGRMRARTFVLALAAVLAVSALAAAQQQTGEIFGKVTDQSGGVLPGVTVTLTAPHLLQPLTAITSETGTYQFPR